jgi:catechol 2,3-dioxygenase-like lactoylglutathione lyase family enzyme
VRATTKTEARAGVSRLSATIPALPVRDVAASVDFYRERLGFDVLHHDGGFAVLGRDDAVLHLWEASDETWRTRDNLDKPVRSGAESFIAGTASCRITVDGVDELYAELRGNDILHTVSKEGVSDTDFGAREFHTVDRDGNLVSFFEWVSQ